MPTDEPLEQGRNRSGLLRSFSVLAACVVPSDEPSLAWNRDVKHIIDRLMRAAGVLTSVLIEHIYVYMYTVVTMSLVGFHLPNDSKIFQPDFKILKIIYVGDPTRIMEIHILPFGPKREGDGSNG